MENYQPIEDHMMAINVDALSKRDVYALLTESIVPRPIAFVSSTNENGTLNAAPFSYFNVVSAKPPLVMVSVGKRRGEDKDTAKNIKRTQEFVINMVDQHMIENVNAASASYSGNESEVDNVGLHAVRSQSIATNGVAESPVRFECEVHQIIPLSEDEEETATLVLGRIKRMQVKRDAFSDGKIDANKLDLVGRLGGEQYTTLGTIFNLSRPK